MSPETKSFLARLGRPLFTLAGLAFLAWCVVVAIYLVDMYFWCDILPKYTFCGI